MDRILATEISIQQKYAKISPIKCSASETQQKLRLPLLATLYHCLDLISNYINTSCVDRGKKYVYVH